MGHASYPHAALCLLVRVKLLCWSGQNRAVPCFENNTGKHGRDLTAGAQKCWDLLPAPGHGDGLELLRTVLH